MQPLLHNKNDSPTPPPPPQRRVGRWGHRIHSDGDDGRPSGVLKFNDFEIFCLERF